MENTSLKARILDRVWRVLQHTMPTVPYLKLRYRIVFKRRLNLGNPKSFNEKLQWLKLYGYRPEYTTMVDKVLVKDYVKSIIGGEYVVPTLKVWDSAGEIDFSILPDRFVLKCNHNSGDVIVCPDKSALDTEAARKRMDVLLHDNYYLRGRETPYKYVERKIFAEEFLSVPDGGELLDYKFFCFDGKPEFLKINFDKDKVPGIVNANYYDLEMNPLPFGEVELPPNPLRVFKAPANMDRMVELAAVLSKGIPFVRVDFYNIDGRIYFGEMTFYPADGFGPFTNPEWDFKLGDMIDLPQKQK